MKPHLAPGKGFDANDPAQFAPALQRIEEQPAAPFAGRMIRLLAGLLAALIGLAAVGELDVVAVADGKLVPSGYLQIVQPAEQGVVKEILVREGQQVRAGDTLVRMDASQSTADLRLQQAEFHTRRLALRRIDAQLAGGALAREPSDPPEFFLPAEAQYRANLQAYENALAAERSQLEKARHDLAAATETRTKLERVLPHYREQEAAFDKLARDGFAGRIMATDKARERIEREQDLRTQEFVIRSNLALIAQSERRIAQITADYLRQLRAERSETTAQFERARQELAKGEHRGRLLELRAPGDGVVKDLATHTPGTVVAPGTILLTLVPRDGGLMAEVWVGNEDVGLVHPGRRARLKLAPFRFQKYGLLDGEVAHVSADATEAPSANTRSDSLGGRDRPMGSLAYRTLVKLGAQVLETDGRRYALGAGMQVSAEIDLGRRTVLEYLLSPVQRAYHEAGRER